MAGKDNGADALIKAARKAFQKPFGATLQILPDDGGVLWVDGASAPPVISDKIPGKKNAACVWRGSRETLSRALESERAFESAYVAGRITIAGDMSVMARLELGGPK